VLAANADLIVMGEPLTSRSLAIKGRTFLFTQYTVRVDRVFFDKAHVVASRNTIIVSRGGGSLEVNDVVVQTVDPAFEQFSINKPYVFALNVLPGTGTYQVTALGTFVIADGLVSSASKLEPPNAHTKSLTDFTIDLERAVAYGR
jgi:hypothetical protein